MEITPQRFLKLVTTKRQSIKSAKFIPPKIGKDWHFGKIKVDLK